ncbi:MAG: hypothetical protein AB9888_03520 [Bacteroidales bacterium]
MPKVVQSVFTGTDCQASQCEFALQAEGVGSFLVRNGSEVEYSVAEGADPGWVRLHLNTRVLVALLHQRKIINFHASSFVNAGRGVMILGDTGAGKTSLTVAFAMKGAGFLSDDLTPVIFKGSNPHIWPLKRDIKLREDTVAQLGITRDRLKDAERGTGKQYLDVRQVDVSDYPLHMILKIETADSTKVEFHEPAEAEKFSLLRSEICSWEILAGMPETEAAYLQQLLKIVEQVRFVRVTRPANIGISMLHEAVRDYLAEAEG